MAAMVWPLMCRIFRMTMKLLLWIVRILERWLKRFDDKTVSFKEDPYLVPIEKVIEPVNLPDENRIQENVTRISIPREPVNTNTQTPDPARVVYNCPLCDCPMLYKKAGRGGAFYGCSNHPGCPSTRNLANRKPGPVKEINRLRILFGELKWAEMEERKCRGIPIPFRLNRCTFCGMEQPDHLGRNCPQRLQPP